MLKDIKVGDTVQFWHEKSATNYGWEYATVEKLTEKTALLKLNHPHHSYPTGLTRKNLADIKI
jgi:hypothetical protein